MNNHDKILEKLQITLKMIYELTDFDNITTDNAKKSREYGRKADKYIKQLIETNEGIEKYKSWLSSKEDYLRWNSALNLYPLFPKKCYNVLLECEKKCNDNIRKSSMKTILLSYSKNIDDDNIFYKKLKKLYNTDNLALLCKE